MFDKQTVEAITRGAVAARLDPAAVLAVAEVESGGTAWAVVEGRREPLIRWEGHYFDRRLKGRERETARAASLAHPQAGAIPNPRSQAARWHILARARALREDAALESVSWGIGQVMGAHWRALGFADAGALVSEARSGVEGQARLMLRFIAHSGLDAALHREDWTGFARGYNGPGYAAGGYHTRIAGAFARHAPRTALFETVRGERVRRMQVALGRAGQMLSADGVFGPNTALALRGFQAARGLVVDGIAGPRTLAALRAV